MHHEIEQAVEYDRSSAPTECRVSGWLTPPKITLSSNTLLFVLVIPFWDMNHLFSFRLKSRQLKPFFINVGYGSVVSLQPRLRVNSLLQSSSLDISYDVSPMDVTSSPLHLLCVAEKNLLRQ